MKKTCTKCNIKKDISEFIKDKQKKNGFKSLCKSCSKLYYETNKDKILKYNKEKYQNNKDNISINRKEYYIKNRDKILSQKVEYRKHNKHIVKKWKENNKDKIKEINKRYFNKKIKEDINFKLIRNLRSRIANAIKQGYGTKAYKTIELLGCTIDVARFHLECQFTEGMTWDNHGEWHIDHIRPCASFDLTDPEQQKQCFHYTNLQPLWAEDNLKKGDKYK